MVGECDQKGTDEGGRFQVEAAATLGIDQVVYRFLFGVRCSVFGVRMEVACVPDGVDAGLDGLDRNRGSVAARVGCAEDLIFLAEG
jgi:hypothetical protein